SRLPLWSQRKPNPTEAEMAKTVPEPTTENLAETENYLIWLAEEPDGEITYHIELNNITLHFFKEEWDEFRELVHNL
ncbi:MAG: hypothetical protein KKC71_06190, partial [Chloroflexi bacterium]|nr:hypothetical protein [Chloroflexota bacterium]